MLSDPRTVIAVNYHRIGDTDPANPLHRLHTVTTDAFTAHLDLMQDRGRIVSPDQVRSCDDLTEVNFVVCFDDVPVSALTGINLMRERGLPVTVSVCGQLADDGWGTRDKVYAITQFTVPDQLTTRTRAWLPADAAELADLPFYHLTKSAEVDPARVRAELIDPLFADVRDHAAPYLTERGYLSWPQVQELAADPLVTLANHTYSHDNLAALTPDAVHRNRQFGSHDPGR